jgi:hypothetical protein
VLAFFSRASASCQPAHKWMGTSSGPMTPDDGIPATDATGPGMVFLAARAATTHQLVHHE